jgi:hypothetical protein
LRSPIPPRAGEHAGGRTRCIASTRGPSKTRDQPPRRCPSSRSRLSTALCARALWSTARMRGASA